MSAMRCTLNTKRFPYRAFWVIPDFINWCKSHHSVSSVLQFKEEISNSNSQNGYIQSNHSRFIGIRVDQITAQKEGKASGSNANIRHCANGTSGKNSRTVRSTRTTTQLLSEHQTIDRPTIIGIHIPKFKIQKTAAWRNYRLKNYNYSYKIVDLNISKICFYFDKLLIKWYKTKTHCFFAHYYLVFSAISWPTHRDAIQRFQIDFEWKQYCEVIIRTIALTTKQFKFD